MGIEVGRVKTKRPRVDVNVNELDSILDSARVELLTEDNHKKLKSAIHAMAENLAAGYRTSEKTDKLFDRGRERERERVESQEPKPGHGRNAAADFTGAEKVSVTHPTLESGCLCLDPNCSGKVYPLKDPSPLVRILAMPPVQATVYQLQRLRCSVCDTVYTAPEPDGVGPDKYDETVASMIAVFKYGMGIPFTRLAGLQNHLGVPLPTTTQWDIVEEAAELVKPVYEELVKEAAQGQVLHSDDTKVRILNVTREAGDKRTGLHTSGLVSVLDEGRRFVALYMSGTQHAGENLRDILALRAQGLSAPILMHDALSWNDSKLSDDVKKFIGNCLVHGRRHVVDQVENFPAECRSVLEALGEVFGYDEKAREQELNPKDRLKYHQAHSGPVMARLHKWLSAQLDEKHVEPNSGLGKAFKYLLTHWHRMTLFLRIPGAPIDNNICERALKKAVLHRKNALFYRTLNGAQVGDLFMSLIHTCELNKVNPFDYLTELQRHPAELRANPSAWQPWNYREQLRPAPD